MKRDAESHAADDLKKAETVKLRNTAENTAFQIEQQLAEHGEKIPAADRSTVEASLNNLKSVLKGDDADAIKKAHDKLMKDAQTIGKVIYEAAAKQAQAAGAGAGGPDGPGAGAHGPGPSGGDGKDDVIDAEFEVKDAK